jgi:hypothetical protein
MVPIDESGPPVGLRVSLKYVAGSRGSEAARGPAPERTGTCG